MKSRLESDVQAGPGGRVDQSTNHKTDDQFASTHYKNWPNSAGVSKSAHDCAGYATNWQKFNALGDCKARVQLPISGHFPSYVAGSLYRTGPGGYKVFRKDATGTFACCHWFDGFTTVHKFDLVPGEDECSSIQYSSYSQVDETIEHARATGRLDGITFGQKRDPCDTLFKKVKTAFQPVLPGGPNSMNIGVALRDVLPAEKARSDFEGRQLMTLATDNHQSKIFDADTLEPLGIAAQAHLHPSLTGPISAAHAATDATTGEIFNYNLSFGAKQTYRVFRASPNGEVKILAEISGSDIQGAYIHSLFITPNFVVLCIWPLHFRKNGIDILWHRNLMDAMTFDDNARTVWLVIDRHHGHGVVKKFTSSAFFSFHTVNAWEEPGQSGEVNVICELVQSKNADILQKFYYENLVSDESNVASFQARQADRTVSLARYMLRNVPLSGGRSARSPQAKKSTAEVIMTTPAGDLPQINPAFAMRRHRYVWSVLDRGKSSFVDGLGKTDMLNQTSMSWEYPRHTPGEPIFVPRPGAQDEDDGVVLTVVLDGDSGTSYLLCLDAKTMKEVGRAACSRAVGLGFHGKHVAL